MKKSRPVPAAADSSRVSSTTDLSKLLALNAPFYISKAHRSIKLLLICATPTHNSHMWILQNRSNCVKLSQVVGAQEDVVNSFFVTKIISAFCFHPMLGSLTT
jgi:hypothetical protein